MRRPDSGIMLCLMPRAVPPTEDDLAVAYELRRIREDERQWSRPQLFALAEPQPGWSLRSIQRYEDGQSAIPYSVFIRWCKALRVNPAEVVEVATSG